MSHEKRGRILPTTLSRSLESVCSAERADKKSNQEAKKGGGIVPDHCTERTLECLRVTLSMKRGSPPQKSMAAHVVGKASKRISAPLWGVQHGYGGRGARGAILQRGPHPEAKTIGCGRQCS